MRRTHFDVRDIERQSSTFFIGEIALSYAGLMGALFEPDGPEVLYSPEGGYALQYWCVGRKGLLN